VADRVELMVATTAARPSVATVLERIAFGVTATVDSPVAATVPA